MFYENRSSFRLYVHHYQEAALINTVNNKMLQKFLPTPTATRTLQEMAVQVMFSGLIRVSYVKHTIVPHVINDEGNYSV